MRASVVINLHSSRSKRHVRAVPQLLRERGIDIDEFAAVEGDVRLRERVERAQNAGAGLVVVGGGDGSMTAAVDVLAHTDATLGVLPLGTGNSFALTLGIALNVERACDVIAAKRVARVDLGVVNGVHFANFATIGLPSEVATAAPRLLKRALGPAAYVAGGLKAFFGTDAFDVKVRSGGGKFRLRTRQIVVASGRYFGRQPLLPEASIVDERLAFFTTTGTSHLELARTYAALGLGWQTALPDAIFFSAKRIVVKAVPKQLVCIDGQPLGKTPAHFSIAPRALRVCVPETFEFARA